MNTTTSMTCSFALLAVIVTSLTFAVLPSMSRADSWELRTVAKEVPGTREIESGKVEKAIRISKVRLSITPENLKVAVLTNLCIGYVVMRDIDQAEQYCDQAASKPKQRAVTYNNRGVLRVLQGDYEAARGDFTIAAQAGCFNGCDPTIAAHHDRPRAVAQRNLATADNRMLAIEATGAVTQKTAQAE